MIDGERVSVGGLGDVLVEYNSCLDGVPDVVLEVLEGDWRFGADLDLLLGEEFVGVLD